MQETLLPAQNWRKSKAYRLLFDEVMAHREALLSLDFPIETRQRRSLAIAFHSIKGGAGFMGLAELAECASQFEKLFASEVQLSSGNRDLVNLATRYQSAASALAKPQTE